MVWPLVGIVGFCPQRDFYCGVEPREVAVRCHCGIRDPGLRRAFHQVGERFQANHVSRCLEIVPGERIFANRGARNEVAPPQQFSIGSPTGNGTVIFFDKDRDTPPRIDAK